MPQDNNETRKKSIEELGAIVGRDITAAETFHMGEVSKQRERGYVYYYGEKIGENEAGKSTHVSKDVFNVVETAKAICLEAFTQSKDVVYFPPQNAEDYYKSQQATAYVNFVFYRENKGYNILHDLLHDGFVAKNGVVKRWWKQQKTYIIETFEDITAEEYEGLTAIPGVKIRKVDSEFKVKTKYPEPVDINVPNAQATPMSPPNPIPNGKEIPMPQLQQMQQGQQGQGGPPGQPPMGPPPPQGPMQGPPPGGPPPQMGMQPPGPPPNPMGAQMGAEQGGPPQPEELYTGEILKEVDTSHIAIENVPPEDFIIDSMAYDIETAIFVAHRKMLTKSECLENGWDKETVESLNFGYSEFWRNMNEKMTRHDFDKTDDPFQLHQGDTTDAERALVYECYRKIDMDGDGIVELWQVFWSGDHVLEVNQVEEIPFNVFTPYPQPYKFYGLSIPDVIHGIQKSKSIIERQIIDNMILTNNARYLADFGFIRNPKDLVDNRIGGVINVTKMDAVIPMPTMPLNPASFSVLQMLDSDKEETTGASKLSQGLEKDALSKQNSYDTIQALTTSANRRLMMFAKHLAEQTLKPLFLAVYRLGMKYESKEKLVMLNGIYVPVTPANFESRVDLEVKVALTPDEKQKQVQSLIMVHNMMMQAPQLQINYGTKEQYTLFQKVMEYMGIDCREILLMDPAKPAYHAAVQAQTQMKQAQMMQQEQAFQVETALKQSQAQNLAQMGQAAMLKATAQATQTQAQLQAEYQKQQEKMQVEAEDLDIKGQRADADEWYKQNDIRIKDEEIALKTHGITGI